MLGYVEDGPNFVTLAMNGWGAAEPAWWLNLQADPEARVELADGEHTVTGRAASGDERARLWARWREIDENLDAFAALRPARPRWSCWNPAGGHRRRLTAPSTPSG